MKIFAQPIVILDTETNGVLKTSEIVEIGALCLDEWGRTRSQFSALIKANDLYSSNAQRSLKINNISTEDLERAPSLATVRDCFMQWWNQLQQLGHIRCVAFNAGFDKRMMEQSGIHLNWGKCLLAMTHDIMKANNHILYSESGRKKRPSLEESCAFFGLEYPENAHRALEDAKVTAQVACKAFPLWNALNHS